MRIFYLLLCIPLAACAGSHRDRSPELEQPLAPRTSKAKLPPTEIDREGHLLRLNYEGFAVWIDCDKRGAVKWRYNAQHDNGNEARSNTFKLDPYVPKECQQTSTKGYGHGYDRGHQVPANHLDHSPVAIQQSNYMTNILPQVSQMNRGAWKLTEEIIECYRDIDELLVIGGVIWGNNSDDDYFVETHGVETPDAFWKVVVRGDGRTIAWIVPNSKEATAKRLDDYLVTVEEIEQLTGEVLPVTGDARVTKPQGNWVVPIGCDRG